MAGRPTKFNLRLSAKIAVLYAKGLTDKQVAKEVGISERTINYWKKTNPEFLQTLNEAKDVADDMIEASLFNRAIGYTHPEEKVFLYLGKPVKVKTFKHYPPDVTAQIFWLKNRRPNEWRENQNQYEYGTQVEGIVSFKEFCINAGYPEPFDKQVEFSDFCVDDGSPRMGLGARGYGKTDYGPILRCAYEIYKAFKQGRIKDETNLIISRSKIRNTSIIHEIGEALIKNNVPIEKQNSNILRVKGHEGKDENVEVLTLKSSFRGRHHKRIWFDDPATEDSVSEADRLLVKKKYDEAYKLNKNIIIIGQPAHEFDLYAELMDKVRVLKMPHGTIPELDIDLEAAALAGLDEKSISMSYRLVVPKDGSSIFADLKSIDKYPLGVDSVAFIDPSDGGDYTAITILSSYFSGVAITGKVYKKAWYHVVDDMGQLMEKYSVKKLAFETNATGSQPIEQLRKMFSIGVVGKHSTTNKHSTILQAGAFSNHIYMAKDAHSEYKKMIERYEEKSKFDDAPDSLARCLEWIGLIRGK